MIHSHCHPRPPTPPKSPPGEGVLLPKIIASDRRTLPNLHTNLQVSGLNGCGPWQLTGVLPGGQPTWRWDCCQQGQIHLSIPLLAQISDGSGCTRTAAAELEVQTCFICPQTDWWRCQLVILPCVRLACSPVCSHNSCFDTVFHVTLDLYLICLKPHFTGGCAPACPPLPLYPPPIIPTVY